MKLLENQIQELAQQKRAGESYSKIRSNLAQQGFSEDEIKTTIREVDEIVLRLEIEQGARKKADTWYWTGLVLAVMALLVTLASNAGWMLRRAPRWVIYLPFFVGIVIMFYGRTLKKKKPALLDRKPDRIRKKRPYK